MDKMKVAFVYNETKIAQDVSVECLAIFKSNTTGRRIDLLET